MMAKKCKYYIDIYKSESALRKLRKFHVLKVFNLRRVQACTVYMLSLLICTHHTYVTHVVIVITAVNRDSVLHMLLLLHIMARSKSGMFLFIRNQFFRFNSAAMDTGLTAKVFCYANMIVTLFRVSANQISVYFSYSFPTAGIFSCTTTDP